MRKSYVDGPYGQLHLREDGSGTPLVLMHQAPMSSQQFDAVYPLFAARGFRAIGFDYPGFGASDPPPAAPRVEDYAHAIGIGLDALGVQRAHLVGHHTGALVANALALARPDLALTLTMHGALVMDAAERTQWLNHVETVEKTYQPKHDGSHWQTLWDSRKRYMPAAFDPALLTTYIVQTVTSPGPYWYGHHAAFTYDHPAAMARLRLPVLLVSNTGDMIHENDKRAHAQFPHFAYREIAGYGVDIVDEASELWVSTIADWIDSTGAA